MYGDASIQTEVGRIHMLADGVVHANGAFFDQVQNEVGRLKGSCPGKVPRSGRIYGLGWGS